MSCKDANTNVYVQNYTSQNSIVVHCSKTEHTIEADVDCYSVYIDIIDNRFIHQASSLKYKTIYESYDASINDEVIFAYPQDSNIIVTLPSAINNGGRRITIKRRTGGLFTLNINAIPGQNIDDINSIEIFYLNESITLVSDGNHWCII